MGRRKGGNGIDVTLSCSEERGELSDGSLSQSELQRGGCGGEGGRFELQRPELVLGASDGRKRVSRIFRGRNSGGGKKGSQDTWRGAGPHGEGGYRLSWDSGPQSSLHGES